MQPQLVENYLKYCNYKKEFLEFNKIDLSDLDFIYPTTFVPLVNLILESSIKNIDMPRNNNVTNYILTILKKEIDPSKTYIPLIELPVEEEKRSKILEHIYQLPKHLQFVASDDNAYSYIVNELVDNIYQHSEFTRAMVMAQKYKNFVELCFFDNGITIAGSFNKKGMKYKDDESHIAIRDALNGLSSKEDEGRGYGLRTCMEIFLKGLDGEVWIISGSGGIYMNKEKRYDYNFSESSRLTGTLISIRVQEIARDIDIYEYLE